MNPTENKRDRWLRVRLSASEEEAINRLYQRRKVPALVRALLLGAQRPEMTVRPPEEKSEALIRARILSQLQSISRLINRSESLSPAAAVQVQAALLSILREMERDHGH
jgi:hypothetical protein